MFLELSHTVSTELDVHYHSLKASRVFITASMLSGRRGREGEGEGEGGGRERERGRDRGRERGRGRGGGRGREREREKAEINH